MTEPTRKENEGVMSSYQMNHINELITECFDFEKIRLDLRAKTHPDNKESALVTAWIYQKYIEMDYAMFFSMRHLKELTEEVFGSLELRGFVLNLTERVSIGLAVFPEDTIEKFISRIKTSISRTRVQTMDNEGKEIQTSSLIVNEIASAYYISGESIDAILKNNFWLVIIYQLLQYLHNTVAFEMLIKARMPVTEEEKQ